MKYLFGAFKSKVKGKGKVLYFACEKPNGCCENISACTYLYHTHTHTHTHTYIHFGRLDGNKKEGRNEKWCSSLVLS